MTAKLSESLEQMVDCEPLALALRGVREISSRDRRTHDTLKTPIRKKYGTDVDDGTANVLQQLYSAVDAPTLVEAVKILGLDDVEDYRSLLTADTMEDIEGEPDLSAVMNVLDQKITEARADREKRANKASKKKHREAVYAPEVVKETQPDGDVFMAKTLSSPSKVKIAWDLDDNNVVLHVDEYERWEKLLGWRKLKELPHGKNKIREELGDHLSDEVLAEVAGDHNDSSSDTDDSDDSSSGQRTRTKPTDEVLNLARGAGHQERSKKQAQDLYDIFDDGDTIGYNDISMVVLFPTTTDYNMTENWWIAGARWPGAGSVAIANCNKGTYEYLSDLDQVWHIEDYLEQAWDYEFQTNAGSVTMDTVATDQLVLHAVSNDVHSRLTRNAIMSQMPHALPEYCDETMYNAPDFPHADDMIYAPITLEDVFWMRPALREQQNPDDEDALLLYADVSIRNIASKKSVSSDYELYARARLPEWDFGSVEMALLDECSYRIELNEGGFELVETLGMLHDKGIEPYSETPKARWD